MGKREDLRNPFFNFKNFTLQRFRYPSKGTVPRLNLPIRTLRRELAPVLSSVLCTAACMYSRVVVRFGRADTVLYTVQ